MNIHSCNQWFKFFGRAKFKYISYFCITTLASKNINKLFKKCSCISYEINTYPVLYADNNQFSNNAEHASTDTWCAGGNLLLRLWYSDETSVSNRVTFTQAVGSSVLRAFSRNASITFHISITCTEKSLILQNVM